MRRRELIRRLRRAARSADVECVSLRNTEGHEVVSFGGLRIAVPNHREVAEGTAASILRQAAGRLDGAGLEGPERWKEGPP